MVILMMFRVMLKMCMVRLGEREEKHQTVMILTMR